MKKTLHLNWKKAPIKHQLTVLLWTLLSLPSKEQLQTEEQLLIQQHP